jgi:hypothetical protein
MKTQKFQLVKMLSLLVFLLGASAAFGFYDPAAQRWINRDPLGDLSFGNLMRGRDMPFSPEDENQAYTFVLNSPILTDPYGLEVYAACRPDISAGGYIPTKSEPTGRVIVIPGVGKADEMRVVQRKCHFRCYHKDTENCPRIPCKNKSCPKDHGVSVLVTINAKGAGAAATCDEILDDVSHGRITGGSITRNFGE